MFDNNDDGKITCKELELQLKKIGIQPTQAELKIMMNEIDIDGIFFKDI